jgi:hypothetical protein
MEGSLLIQGWGVLKNHAVAGKIAKLTLWRNQAQWTRAEAEKKKKREKQLSIKYLYITVIHFDAKIDVNKIHELWRWCINKIHNLLSIFIGEAGRPLEVRIKEYKYSLIQVLPKK